MLAKIGRLLGYLNPLRWISWLRHTFSNFLRRFKKLDYVLFTLDGSMPALPEPRGWLLRKVQGDPPMSLYELDEIFQRIAQDPRPKGIILHLRGLGGMAYANLQTLHNSVERFKEHNKRVICFLPHGADLKTYYVASITDEILVQPTSELFVPGFQMTPMFLKDALDAIGVQFDVVAISPYKGAGDTLSRNSMSPEYEEQTNRLIDSIYNTLVDGIAAGRNLTADAVKQMIDQGLIPEALALEAGYVDGILNEEGLPAHLGTERIQPWEKAEKAIRKQWRKNHPKYVAMVRIGGMIINGKSGKPPFPVPVPIFGQERVGDLTVVQDVRRVMKDKRAAALLVYVDSGGGSASSSESMTAALSEVAKDRPVVVYMNNVAASGGYYVATPGQWIVAQPTTITGSIGVLMGKPVNQDMMGKLRINREVISRGENAGFLSPAAPFTESQRAALLRSIESVYNRFTHLVANSRNMTQDDVDAIGGGRVWTGAEAIENGLVDELGGLETALKKAQELAELSTDAPLLLVKSKGDPLAPQLAQQANPAALLSYLHDGLNAVGNGRAQFLLPLTWE
jgi:protease IV